jgi:hypothetical protein
MSIAQRSTIVRELPPEGFMRYRHCLLRKGVTQQIAWIPEPFAKVGEYLRIGESDAWLVDAVYSAKPEEYILKHRDECRNCFSEVLLGGSSSGRAADFESASCYFDRRPPSHCWGVAKMERQQALTLPSSVRITPPQPDFMCPVRSTDRMQGYEPWDRSSNLRRGTNIPSSNWKGHSPPKPGFRFESGGADHARGWPTGKALDCRSRSCGFNSRSARQIL